MIQRHGDGFLLDQNRVAYLRYLRREKRQSPRSEADTDFQRAKSELIRLRIAEKQRNLIPLDEAVAHMDEVVGLFLTHLSGLAARCGARDPAVRRSIDGRCMKRASQSAKPRASWPTSAANRHWMTTHDDRCRDDRR